MSGMLALVCLCFALSSARAQQGAFQGLVDASAGPEAAGRLIDGAAKGRALPVTVPAAGGARLAPPPAKTGTRPEAKSATSLEAAPADPYATLPGGQPVRSDERFHLQAIEPIPFVQQWGPLRRVSWRGLVKEDGSTGSFVSWSLWGWQIYYGTVKCDGSRTYALRQGQLGGTAAERQMFVMTTTPKEKLAFRHHPVAAAPTWDNMGGS